MFKFPVLLTFALSTVLFSSSVLAAKCTAFKVVGSGLTAVHKAIESPSTLITSNNWNNDFSVPAAGAFKKYVATVYTEQNGQYDLKMIFKYSDGSSKTVYEQPARAMGVKDAFSMTGRTRKRPYQVNVLTGGTAAVGKTVMVKVVGCR